jgi:chlorobactene lauroyltransferase
LIPARKSWAFNFVLRRWMAAILRRRFHNIYIAGAEHSRALDPARPVVACVNHTNWWDGFLIYVLSDRLLPHDIYLAMEEENLRRYRFFSWMGVFGIDLTHVRAALPGVRYAIRLLKGSARRMVWIFVQGRLAPAHKPIEVKGGALFLARQTGAQVLPLIVRYEWLSESRPSIFVQVGAPMLAAASEEHLAGVLNELFARVADALDPIDLSNYQPLFAPRLSMNKRWDYFVHRLLRRRGTFHQQNR